MSEASRRPGDALSALVVLGLFGFWAIAVFAAGVWFLVWVLRLAVLAWFALAYALRWAYYEIRPGG